MFKDGNEMDPLFGEDVMGIPIIKYEFISLKFFAEEEELEDNKRKYRTVFQSKDLDYLHAEISFNNLRYKIKDWDFVIRCKITTDKDETLAEFNFREDVSEDENVKRVIKGYGNEVKGKFWKKGVYNWFVWFNGRNVAKNKIYIENRGNAGNKGTPYMMLQEVKLFDTTNEYDLSDRIYCKGFIKENTGEVDVELSATNLLYEICDWTGEFIFIFKTELGEKKAEIREVRKVSKNERIINMEVVHSEDISFSNGLYYVEVIFMEKLIARVPFNIGSDEVLSTIQDRRTLFSDSVNLFISIDEQKDIIEELNGLIGLAEVKKTVNELLTYINFVNLRQSKGIAKSGKINLNSLFTGNPGTGKTVVARMLGKIYKNIGLLSSGHVYEVGRPELVAEYIGQTAIKTKEAIEKARGGVLFIDEAYSLARENSSKRDYGAEVIEVLLKEMSDGPGDIAIIAAGYSDAMDIFLDSNPGLKSRFKHIFNFTDYNPNELLEIAEYHCRKKKLSLGHRAKIQLQKIITKEWRNRDKNFGNARYVNAIIDKAEMNLSQRIMNRTALDSVSKNFMSRIEPCDLDMAILRKHSGVNLPVDKDGLEEALKELNDLRGLKNVKDDVNKLSKLIKFYKEEGINPLSKISLHSVFTGNPGTGKTTVARIMAKIYCSLGIIERGHLVECSRESLVSGYSGQTAIKTADMIDKAMGGVLFIDEAYSLAGNGSIDYGKEVIETLLKKMEDRRGEFIVICAGYSEQMKYFLDSNPGLRSRFDKFIEFKDYSFGELFDILIDILKTNNINLYDELVYIELMIMTNRLCESKSKYFANAREIRKLAEQIIFNQNIRVSEIPKSKRTDEDKKTLLMKDIKSIKCEETEKRMPLGFG